jgi:TusA-related sulfurtransferase
VQTSNLTTLGELENMKPKEKPAEIIFSEDVLSDDLDFHKINQATKDALKKSTSGKSIKVLSTNEKKAIPLYIKDITSYIKKYAAQGKFKFEYDCSKLTEVCFHELAHQFKQKNPLFFVVKQHYTQILTIEWSGKNEV